MPTWEMCKQQGNAAYGSHDFEVAVAHYTQALESSPPESQTQTLLSNRCSSRCLPSSHRCCKLAPHTELLGCSTDQRLTSSSSSSKMPWQTPRLLPDCNQSKPFDLQGESSSFPCDARRVRYGLMCTAVHSVWVLTLLLLSGRFTKALFRKALALEGLQQLPQALEELQEARSLQPKDTQVCNAML